MERKEGSWLGGTETELIPPRGTDVSELSREREVGERRRRRSEVRPWRNPVRRRPRHDSDWGERRSGRSGSSVRPEERGKGSPGSSLLLDWDKSFHSLLEESWEFGRRREGVLG